MEHLDRTRETYERIAGEYAARHGDRSVIDHLREPFEARLPTEATVLDVGCGPGWEAATFHEHGASVLALDLASAFCGQAAERVPGRVLRGDMRRLPVATAAVDGVWACASLLHLPRRAIRPTLAEFARVLAPEGWCCLSVKHGSGTMESDAYAGDDRTFTLVDRDELWTAFEAAGFAVDELERADGWVTAFASPA